MRVTKPYLYGLSILLLLFFAACNNIDYPSEKLQTNKDSFFSLSTLRVSSNISGDDNILVSAWGETKADSLFIGFAEKNGDKWKLNKEYKVDKKCFFSFVYPDTLLRYAESILVMESDQTPVYYCGIEVGPKDNKHLNLTMNMVQAKIGLLFDLSDFSNNDMVEEVRVRSRYTYGWLNLHQGSFSRMDIPFDETTLYTKEINKNVGSLTDNNGLYKYTYLMMPQKDTEMTIWVRINGKDHIAFIPFGEVQSNKEYLYKVDLLNRYKPVDLTDQEKQRGETDPLPKIKKIGFTDYEYTCTNEYMMDLNNKQGVVLSFWMDSRIEQTKQLEYKLLILDGNNHVVSQSPIYGGLTIKGYHYDGFAVPFYLDTPSPGRYRYKLLIREKGQEEWYEPNQKFDDAPDDVYFNVHEGQTVFATSFRLDANGPKSSISGISMREYNKQYTAQYSLNNYSSQDQIVTIRLYNRRKPLEGHSYLELENPATWEDFIGSASTTIKSRSSGYINIDYMLTKRRPNVTRFSPYVCATIEYNNSGKQYPLHSDGDLLYKISSHLYSPGIAVSNSGVVNKSYIEFKE